VITTVGTSTGLLSALKTARPGDVIKLSPGDYSAMKIYKVEIAGEVTITSADASNPAVLHGLSVENSRGLTFTNLEMVIPSVSNANGAAVGSSSYIRFDNVNVHGAKPGDANAITIRNSDHVSVVNSDIHDAWIGISHLNSNYLTFSRNTVHDIKADGIRGGGSSNVVISDNHFTNFYPDPADHPDAIQFWTVNTAAAARDIVITGNTFVRGDGKPIQGIFVGNENRLPFENVTITGNAIIGGMYHGISLDTAVNARIEGNIVQGYSDMTSWIGIFRTNNAIVSNNQANYFKFLDSKGVSDRGNKTLRMAKIGDDSILAKRPVPPGP
jgi:nitrous oxidase accessory protein NosD